MAVKLVKTCPVCGGWGRFLSKKCPQCKGSGGKILKFTEETQSAFSEKKSNLSEQEKALFDFYKIGFSKKAIAENLDIPILKVIPMLYSIEKKLNKVEYSENRS